MRDSSIPSIEHIRSLLSYDPDTGILRWRVRTARCIEIGSIAGSIKQDGYRVVSIGRKGYPAHRLAWVIAHGVWPTEFIDHINCVKDDNRLSNLREADRFLNSQNQRKAHKRNACAILGVHFYARTGRWRASVWFEGKAHWIGYFSTAEQAEAAYIKRKRELHDGCTL
jgi:hypothetical protein